MRTAVGDLLGGAVLDQVAAGAGPDGVGEHLLVGVHGEHHDLDVGQLAADLAGGLDAVELGHRDVHEDDVGLELVGQARRPRRRRAASPTTSKPCSVIERRSPSRSMRWSSASIRRMRHGVPRRSGDGLRSRSWRADEPVADGVGRAIASRSSAADRGALPAWLSISSVAPMLDGPLAHAEDPVGVEAPGRARSGKPVPSSATSSAADCAVAAPADRDPGGARRGARRW